MGGPTAQVLFALFLELNFRFIKRTTDEKRILLGVKSFAIVPRNVNPSLPSLELWFVEMKNNHVYKADIHMKQKAGLLQKIDMPKVA